MRLAALFAFVALLHASVPDSADRLLDRTAEAPAALRIEYRVLAAQALQERYPALARKLVNAVVEEVRATKNPSLSPDVLRSLAAVAPSDAMALLPLLPPDSGPALAAYLVQGHHPTEAARLFRQTVSTIDFGALDPARAWDFLSHARTVGSVAPGPVTDAYERLVLAASKPGYGQNSRATIMATFQLGDAVLTVTNWRETILIVAGSRLRALAPERFERVESVFAKWDLSLSLTQKSVTFGQAGGQGGAPAQSAPELASIEQRLQRLRDLPTDQERAKTVIEVAAAIRAQPDARVRLTLAHSLSLLSTEGNLGKDAVRAGASTLAAALEESPGNANHYLWLATLVRYEHVPAPAASPGLASAALLLELRDQLRQEAGFSLISLDGRTYTLAGLRGKIVLVNFWATWCPPCRKEMPDMEKLYRRFEKRGLVVLAISDEPLDTVAPFIAKQGYTFPILLDPDRKVHGAFQVEGIPQSFLFDRAGRLAAQAIDSRTEPQFLELLKQAGLQ